MEDFSGVHFGESNRLPDEYFTEIGRVIVKWAFFEQTFEFMVHGLWEKLHPKKSKPSLTIPFRRRRKLWLDLILGLTKEKTTIDEARAISSEAGRLRNLRDYMAHGVWLPILKPDSFEPKSYRLAWVKTKAQPVGDVLPRTLDDFKTLSKQIDELGRRAQEVIKKIFPDGYGVRYP